MSDEREPEQANEPEAEVSTNTTDVRDAIERAKEASAEHPPTPDTSGTHATGTAAATSTDYPVTQAQSHNVAEQQPVVDHGADQSHYPQTPGFEPVAPAAVAEPVAPATQQPIVQHEEPMPSAVEQTYPPAGAHPETQQGAPVQIDPDHPMAALYIQQPMPPNLKGNRLGGVLISLLATLGFAVVYAGVIAIWRALEFPPSTFLQEGLLPFLTSLGYVLPVVMFFIAMMILVLVVNKAGWWAYVLGGFIVALLVWLAAGAGYALSPQLGDLPSGQEGDTLREANYGLGIDKVKYFAFTLPALMAALVAREVSIWFGGWIGARGRRVKARNAEAMKEYEAKVVEVQARLS